MSALKCELKFGCFITIPGHTSFVRTLEKVKLKLNSGRDTSI